MGPTSGIKTITGDTVIAEYQAAYAKIAAYTQGMGLSENKVIDIAVPESLRDSSLPMTDQNRFRNDAAQSAGLDEPNNGGDQMNGRTKICAFRGCYQSLKGMLEIGYFCNSPQTGCIL